MIHAMIFVNEILENHSEGSIHKGNSKTVLSSCITLMRGSTLSLSLSLICWKTSYSKNIANITVLWKFNVLQNYLICHLKMVISQV